MSDGRPVHADDEARIADDLARELEALAGASRVPSPAGFADRVMASIASEPLPQPVRAFGAAVAVRRLAAALASIGDAWRVAAGGAAPMAVRAQALALVLVVAVGSLAVAGGAAVGAIDILNATQAATPQPTAPQPSELHPTPSPSPTSSPSPSLAPAPSAEPQTGDPTETPEATDGGGSTSRPPTATPRATRTEDAGGGRATPTATGTDDHGGGGSGGGETPRPTGTDDLGGGGGDG